MDAEGETFNPGCPLPTFQVLLNTCAVGLDKIPPSIRETTDPAVELFTASTTMLLFEIWPVVPLTRSRLSRFVPFTVSRFPVKVLLMHYHKMNYLNINLRD